MRCCSAATDKLKVSARGNCAEHGCTNVTTLRGQALMHQHTAFSVTPASVRRKHINYQNSTCCQFALMPPFRQGQSEKALSPKPSTRSCRNECPIPSFGALLPRLPTETSRECAVLVHQGLLQIWATPAIQAHWQLPPLPLSGEHATSSRSTSVGASSAATC